MAQWSDREVAIAYRRFTEEFPMYAATSRDLVARADIASAQFVVDLCSGTGQTTKTILAGLPADGRMLALDGSPAMQAEARRTIHDHRVEYVIAKAEQLTLPEPADAIICNSAIWQTDMPATFAAARRALKPDGRLVFNLGQPFIRIPGGPRRQRPEFIELMLKYTKSDYGFVPRAPRPTDRNPELIDEMLRTAGFAEIKHEIERYESTVDQIHAWLSIPIFAGAFSGMPEEHRLAALDKAYRNCDKNQITVNSWLIVTAR